MKEEFYLKFKSLVRQLPWNVGFLIILRYYTYSNTQTLFFATKKW